MRLFWQLLPFAAGLLATIALGGAATSFAAYYYLQPALPSVEEMRDIRLQIPLRIYSRDGLLMGENILAIQGLNVADDNVDFLLSPQLDASV